MADTCAMVDQRTIRRVLRVALGLVIAMSTLTAQPAAADEYSDASYFVAIANDLRASYGLAPLDPAEDLESVAQGWARHMARRGVLAHNPSLATDVADWWMLGENVAYGWENGGWDIHLAWINSPGHFANLVKPEYNQIGLGVAYDEHGGLYVAQVFAAR